jgi:hypothetical protein
MKRYLLFFLFIFLIKLLSGQAPVINQQPNSLHECVGSEGDLKIMAEGSQPLMYQWFHNGIPVGTGFHILSFSELELSDAGEYYCEVSNSEGSTMSETSFIVVDAETPEIHNVSSQYSIVCLGASNEFEVDFTGSNSTTRWFHGDNFLSYNPTYTLQNADYNDEGVYYCTVENACGFAESESLEIEIASPPTITTQPHTTTVCEGGSVIFNVEAEGDCLYYIWSKNGAIIPTAQTSSLEIIDIAYPHTDYYSVNVYNICNTEGVISNTVYITVNTEPTITGQPLDQIMCETEATTIYASGYSTTDVNYQWYNTDTGLIPNANLDSLVIAVVEGVSTGYYFEISNLCGTVESDIAEIYGKESPSILIQPIGAELCVGEDHEFQIKTEGTPPLYYQWQKNGLDVYGANIQGTQETIMEITETNAGQGGDYYCIVTNECGSISSDTVELIVNTPPSIIEFSQDKEVCEGENFNLSINILGSDPLNINWYILGSETTVFNEAEFSFESALPENSGEYYCLVSNMCGEVSSDTINIFIKALPEITQNPIGAELCVGDFHEMTITATGEEPLSYLWYRNGSTLSAETNNEIIITNAQVNQSGIYFCRVANDCAYIDSEETEIIIGSPPAITWNPTNQTLCEHQTLNLIMDAQGENYSLQWYHNDIPISGAHDTVLNIPNINLQNSGNYYCLAYNACESVSTDTVELIVNLSPEIDLGPDIDLCEGETITIGTDLAYSHYNWNNGLSHQQYLELALGGTFILEVVGENNCTNSDTIIVTFHPFHNLALINDEVISCGPYTINAGTGAYSYEWSTGEISSSITVNLPGTYSVTVTGDSFGCETSASIFVDLREPISFSLGNDILAHVDTYVNIGIEHIFSEYLWNTGFTGPMLSVYGSEYGSGEHEFWLTAYALNGCSHTDTIKVTFYGQAGIEDETENNISIYPNPANEFIIFKSNEMLIEYIEFYDISGKLISKEIVNNCEVKYNLSNFAKGLYLIKIIGENNKIINTKVLVQ